MKSPSPVLPHIFVAHHRVMLGFWGGLVLLNLCAALVIASLPERQVDLHVVSAWAAGWLLNGSDIYSTEVDADYPPHAILALSPLAFVPENWLVPVWASVNIALALLVPYLAVRWVRPTVTVAEAALPVLMFLTWGGFRTLLQFTLFAVTFGLLAMVSEKRPVWGGICLGLALTKPQIGAPFFCGRCLHDD